MFNKFDLENNSGGEETSVYRNFLETRVKVEIFLLLGSSFTALTPRQEGDVGSR